MWIIALYGKSFVSLINLFLSFCIFHFKCQQWYDRQSWHKQQNSGPIHKHPDSCPTEGQKQVHEEPENPTKVQVHYEHCSPREVSSEVSFTEAVKWLPRSVKETEDSHMEL